MEELYNRLKTGERLRNKRKKIGWSQERAADDEFVRKVLC